MLSGLRLLIAILLILPLWATASVYEVTLNNGFEWNQVNPPTLENIKGWKNSEWPPNRNLYQLVEQSLYQIQTLQIITQEIVPILQSYHATTAGGDGLTAKYVDLFQQVLIRPQNYDYSQSSPYRQVVVEASSGEDSDRFLVDGVNKDRLAITDDKKITFNLRGLDQQKPSVPALIHLLLHELSHVDQGTPLEMRDAWASKIASWVESRTTTLDFGGKKLIAIALPPPAKAKEIYISNVYSEDTNLMIDEARKNFVAIYQTAKSAEIAKNIYNGFKSFEDRVNKPFKPSPGANTYVLVPQVEVTGVKINGEGKLQIDYTQKSLTYITSPYRNGQFTFYPGAGGNTVVPGYGSTQYRIFVNKNSDAVETQRTYSQRLSEVDFEIYRVQDIEKRRFLSLRLHGPAGMIKQDTPIHLIAKDMKHQKVLSIPLSKRRALNTQETLLHFEVPQRNIELSYLLVPHVTTDGFYSEENIRSSRPASLTGNEPLKPANLEVTSFAVPQKIKDTDKLTGTIDFKAEKRLTGITLEIEHTLKTQEVSINGFQQVTSNDLSYVGRGRKYHIPLSELKVRNQADGSQVQFHFPEASMEQVRAGTPYTLNHGKFYKERIVPRFITMKDTSYRQIGHLWFHFEDGTSEKVSAKHFPKEITVMSVERFTKKMQEAAKYAQQFEGGYDEPDVLSCKEIFK